MKGKTTKINQRLRNSRTSSPIEDDEYPFISIDVFAIFPEKKRIAVVYYNFERKLWLNPVDDSIIIDEFLWFDLLGSKF